MGAAEIAVIGAGLGRNRRNETTGCVVLMLAVQHPGDAAHIGGTVMGAGQRTFGIAFVPMLVEADGGGGADMAAIQHRLNCLAFLSGVGRGVAAFRMLVEAGSLIGIALLPMVMGAGLTRHRLLVTTGCVVRRVVLTENRLGFFRKGEHRQIGAEHAETQQQRHQPPAQAGRMHNSRPFFHNTFLHSQRFITPAPPGKWANWGMIFVYHSNIFSHQFQESWDETTLKRGKTTLETAAHPFIPQTPRFLALCKQKRRCCSH